MLRLPANKIKTREIIPIDLAIPTSSKLILPKPSVPASIPTSIKRTKDGIPRLSESLVTKILTIIRTDITRTMYSKYLYYFLKYIDFLLILPHF